MNDLNTINRLNAERFSDPVDSARANGKHVLVYKSGLSVTEVKTFDTAEETQEHTKHEDLAAGVSRHYLAPTARPSSNDQTLVDYVARKTA